MTKEDEEFYLTLCMLAGIEFMPRIPRDGVYSITWWVKGIQNYSYSNGEYYYDVDINYPGCTSVALAAKNYCLRNGIGLHETEKA